MAQVLMKDLNKKYDEVHAVKVHDPVLLALNPDRLHFFDTKMQLSI